MKHRRHFITTAALGFAAMAALVYGRIVGANETSSSELRGRAGVETWQAVSPKRLMQR